MPDRQHAAAALVVNCEAHAASRAAGAGRGVISTQFNEGARQLSPAITALGRGRRAERKRTLNSFHAPFIIRNDALQRHSVHEFVNHGLNLLHGQCKVVVRSEHSMQYFVNRGLNSLQRQCKGVIQQDYAVVLM